MTVNSAPLALDHPPQFAALAAILLDLSNEIEAVGSRFCTDPEFVANHLHDLQIFDRVCQVQKEVADLLVAECPACAMQNLRLDFMRLRLATDLPHINCSR